MMTFSLQKEPLFKSNMDPTLQFSAVSRLVCFQPFAQIPFFHCFEGLQRPKVKKKNLKQAETMFDMFPGNTSSRKILCLYRPHFGVQIWRKTLGNTHFHVHVLFGLSNVFVETWKQCWSGNVKHQIITSS